MQFSANLNYLSSTQVMRTQNKFNNCIILWSVKRHVWYFTLKALF